MPLMMITEYGAIREMPELTPDEAAELQRRLRVRDRQLEAVRQISKALYSQNNINDLLEETLSVALKTVDAETGSILLYDPETRRLKFHYWLPRSLDLTQIEIDPETDVQGKAAQVFREGKSVKTLDVRTQGYNPDIDKATGYHTHDMLTVPIIAMDGEKLGVLQAINKRYEPFNDDDTELLEIISSQAAVFLQNASLAQKAKFSAIAKALGDISHDVKNYLSPIISAMQTLDVGVVAPLFTEVDARIARWKTESPEKAKELEELMLPLRIQFPPTLQSCEDGCTDIKELVSEIADYMRGTAGFNRVTQSIGTVVTERLSRLQAVASNKKITIWIVGEHDVSTFAFDRRLVGRAVYNLANNAIGAISDAVKREDIEYRQGYNIIVRLSAITDPHLGECCQIDVEDDGYGVPQYVKDKLFSSAAISTTEGGTGMGTRFVKDVAERHGGSVGVESELGKGARFWMRLPMRKEEKITA